jgi:putative ABC transport system permease protein
MQNLLRDIRLAIRGLKRTPGFSLAAIGTLALGIGGVTAVFSLVNGILLKPLAYHEPERLVLLFESVPAVADRYPMLPAAASHFEQWREQAASLEDLAAIHWSTLTLTGAREPRSVGAISVSASFLRTLGVSPAAGRDFTADDDHPGNDRVVIVTDRYWRAQLSSSASAIGQTLRLNGQLHEVIGVLPPKFRFPRSGMLSSFGGETPDVDLLKPVAFRSKPLNGQYNYTVLGRLREGVSDQEALAELNVIQAGIAAQIGGDTELGAVIKPFADTLVGSARAGLLLALGAVGAVLLIACVNLANLLLARGSARRHDMAIRAALGAGSRSLLRQSLLESLCLAVCGGFLGLSAAHGVVAAFVGWAPVELPRLSEVGVNGGVLVFASIATLLCAIVSGLVPAWRASRTDPQEALQTGRRSGATGAHGLRVHNLFVGAQVALSTLLLAAAGLLLHSFARVMERDAGVAAENVMAVEVNLTPPAYNDSARRITAWRDLNESVAHLPGVRAVGLISQLPFTRAQNLESFLPKEAAPLPIFERPMANVRYITEDYFEAMGIQLRAGEVFRDNEREGRPVVISASLARALWPDEDPIGREMRTYTDKPPYARVVGVVDDVPVASLEADSARVVYSPYWEKPWRRVAIVVRSAMDPKGLASALSRAVWEVEPGIPVPAPKTIASMISDSVARRRFDLSLVLLFAATSLLLAFLGIYGLVSYGVARRRNEIGVRLALGARTSGIALHVLRRGMAPVVWGLVVGLVGAIGFSRLLESMLFEVEPLDQITFLAVPVLLAIVAVTACFLPAFRASRIQPVEALRYE